MNTGNATSESNFFGVSIRGWLVLLLVLTMCLMSFLGKEIKEPLQSSILLGMGFYFGQKSMNGQNGNGKELQK